MSENTGRDPARVGEGGNGGRDRGFAGGLPWWVVALAVVVSALPLRYPDGVHMATESIRVYAAMALVDTGQACVNPVFDRYYPGWAAAGFLPNIDAAVRDGCYLLDKAPLMTWLALPWTFLLSRLGYPGGYPALAVSLVLLLVTLPVLVGLLRVRAALLARGLVEAPALDLALVALVLASPFLANMGLFLSHALVGVCVVLGLALALGEPRDRGETSAGWFSWAPFLGGGLLGAAVLLEYPAAFFAVAAGLALLVDRGGRGRIPAFVLGGLAPLIALLVWNTLVFGGPLEISYAYKAYTEHQAIHEEGFFGLSTLRPSVLWGLTFGASRGLFFFAPWALVGLVGVGVVARDRGLRLRWRVGVPLAVFGYFLLIGSFTDWEAGQVSVGPRHLVVLLPALAVLAARALSAGALSPLLRLGAGAVLVGGAAFGVAVNVLAANVFPHLPDQLVNPFFEVIVPVLLEAGPSPTVLGGWVSPWVGLGVQLGVAFGLLGWATARWVGRSGEGLPARGRSVALGGVFAVLWLALAVGPEAEEPRQAIHVLHHRAQIHDLRGHSDLATDYRRLIQERRAALRGARPPEESRP